MIFLIASLVHASPLERCHPAGVSSEAYCAKIPSRSENGSTILNVMLLPAIQPKADVSPLFILAGGPGQPGTTVAPYVAPVMQELQRARDLVFIDQRGTGQSSPLNCADEPEDLSTLFNPQFSSEQIKSCLEEMKVNPAEYLTSVAADDIEDIRIALGYQQIDLYGISYGTRLALETMRRHPTTVRSAILDGAVGFSTALGTTFEKTVADSLQKIFSDCREDAPCSKAFPSLEADFSELLSKMNEPISTRIHHPFTHEKMEISISRKGFLSGIRSLLYSAAASSMLPFTVTQANQGDWSPFVAQIADLQDNMDLSFGLNLTIICSEDAPRYSQNTEKDSIFGDMFRAEVLDMCAEWPSVTVPDSFFEELKSETPVLILSGALDPVTPPSGVAKLQVGLSRSIHFIAPGLGHNVGFNLCAVGLMRDFLDGDGPDGTCLQSYVRPPFFLGHSGPQP